MPDRVPPSVPLPDPAAAVLRCAPYRASLGVDPVGSAGAYDAFLCVEVPLPWERDISLSEPFRSLVPEPGRAVAALVGVDGRRWRPVGLVPRDGDDGGGPADGSGVTVIALEQDAGAAGVGPLRRSEWRTSAVAVPRLCRTVVDGGDLSPFEADRIDPGEVVDLLVCTHGSRDVCCGGMGSTLQRRLRERLADDPGVRVWRCSHTGGHRFAPTGLTFPDGYAWAGLDEDVAVAVARRDGEAALVAGHCRGSSLLAGAPLQAADRVGLERAGWAWARSRRAVELVDAEGGPFDGGPTSVSVRGPLPAEGGDAPLDVVVDVVVTGEVPTPDCGTRQGPGEVTEPVWGVAAVRERAAGP